MITKITIKIKHDGELTKKDIYNALRKATLSVEKQIIHNYDLNLNDCTMVQVGKHSK